MMILHPPLPLHFSPCPLPLPKSVQRSTTDCLFCSLLPLRPLAVVHTTQHRQLLVLHCNCDRSRQNWHAPMILMTIMSSAKSGCYPVGPVGASSRRPQRLTSITLMTTMQHNAKCCSIPITLLCRQTCCTFVLSSCLPCHPVVSSVASHSCVLGGMVAWHPFGCSGEGM